MIPETIIPRLKAEYDPEKFPREFKPQTIEITAQEHAALHPGDTHQANRVIAICWSKEYMNRIHFPQEWSATFHFSEIINPE